MSRAVILFAFLFVAPFSCILQAQSQVTHSSQMTEQVKQFRELLDSSPDELARIGEKKAIEVIGELTFGRELAKQARKEANAERNNLELRKYFDGLKDRNEEIRGIVSRETRRIRDQHADDPAECDRRLLKLIDSFKDERAALRENARIAKALMKKAKADLSLAGDLVASIERRREQLERDLIYSPGRTPGVLVQFSRPASSTLGLDPSVLKKFDIELAELGLESPVEQEVAPAKSGTPRDVARELADFDTDFDFK